MKKKYFLFLIIGMFLFGTSVFAAYNSETTFKDSSARGGHSVFIGGSSDGGKGNGLEIYDGGAGYPSFIRMYDGGSTAKGWTMWWDSTNSVLRCSSCGGGDTGGAECPDESGFDETDGQVVGSQS